jgi:hypothetical protein
MKENTYQKFINQTEVQLTELLNEYKKKIQFSKEGFEEKAHNKFYKKICDDYLDLQKKLGDNSRFFIEIKDELEDDKSKDFETLFNKKFSKIKVKNNTSLMSDLIRLYVLQKASFEIGNYKLKTLPNNNASVSNNNEKEKIPINKIIFWNSNTELEFTQLIYILHKAGYLKIKNSNLKKGEKGANTLVLAIAKILDYNLGKNWYSNIYKSIRDRKKGYKPELIKNLEIAFNELLNSE